MAYRSSIRSCISTEVLVVVLDVKTQTEENVVPDEHLHSESKQTQLALVPTCGIPFCSICLDHLLVL